MIFIWTSSSGPLQCVGLAIFALQFIRLNLPALSASLNENPSATTALLGLVLSLVLALLAAALYGWRTGAFGRLAESASRSAAEAAEAVRRFTGIADDRAMALLLGSAVVVVSALAIFADGYVIASLFHVAAVCLILRAQMVGRAEQRGRRGRSGDEAESREAKLAEIVRIVQKMPLEEFVPEEDVAGKCSVSQLKKMLEVRGRPMEASTCLERRDLVDAVRECRNYCDTCCICCEEYNEGDPLRILPRCRHEFHLECLDQWAYTFANKTKRKRVPSCPLCNEALK